MRVSSFFAAAAAVTLTVASLPADAASQRHHRGAAQGQSDQSSDNMADQLNAQTLQRLQSGNAGSSMGSGTMGGSGMMGGGSGMGGTGMQGSGMGSMGGTTGMGGGGASPNSRQGTGMGGGSMMR
jgi:hypothetical protein